MTGWVERESSRLCGEERARRYIVSLLLAVRNSYPDSDPVHRYVEAALSKYRAHCWHVVVREVGNDRHRHCAVCEECSEPLDGPGWEVVRRRIPGG